MARLGSEWLTPFGLSLLASALVRKKTMDDGAEGRTKLAKCLGTVDLVALGVGSTLGAGVYVIAGEVAQKTTGPAVIVSFFIAAAASVLAGLCYAEFGARVHKSGSAYAYSYVCVGELMAFVIGWNLILEYAIGAASVSRAWSQNFDSLVGGKIVAALRSAMPMSQPGLAEYADFLALGIILLLTVVVSVGVKESAWVTKIFTLINLVVLSVVFLAGLWLTDPENWRIRPGVNGTVEFGNVTYPASAVGEGGFMPFGVRGIVSGAGTCFYAFIGFDTIATTGEEVRNPQRSIPLSIVLSLSICFVAYFGLSAVLTLMLPYFALDPLAPLPDAFASHGWSVANYVIAVGAVCALSTSLLGSMFPLPRVVYAMASDGLVFRFLARVQPRLSTPVVATVITGTLAGTMSCLFELKELVDMMSIGTLLAYTLVAVSVLIMRGTRDELPTAAADLQPAEAASDDVEGKAASSPASDADPPAAISSPMLVKDPPAETPPAEPLWKKYLRCAFTRHRRDAPPTAMTQKIAVASAAMYMVAALLLAVVIDRSEGKLVTLGVLGLPLLLVCLLLVAVLRLQPQSGYRAAFRVPWVPFLPCVSIGVNLYLMVALPTGTWLRFLVWMAVGFVIYFGYGLWHSTEHRVQTRPRMEEQRKRWAQERAKGEQRRSLMVLDDAACGNSFANRSDL